MKIQKVLLKREDGGVSIMSLILENPRDGLVQTADEETISYEISKLDYVVTSWELIDDDAIPEDRTFRSAWNHDLEVDMDKAKEIHKQRLRDARTPVLDALDIEYQKADEKSDIAKKQEIASRKQALRDITKHPEILAATSPEELKVAALKVLE